MTHGGKRLGAGRKPSRDAHARTTSISLTVGDDELLSWLAERLDAPASRIVGLGLRALAEKLSTEER